MSLREQRIGIIQEKEKDPYGKIFDAFEKKILILKVNDYVLYYMGLKNFQIRR
jgi:hypothetical protein